MLRKVSPTFQNGQFSSCLEKCPSIREYLFELIGVCTIIKTYKSIALSQDLSLRDRCNKKLDQKLSNAKMGGLRQAAHLKMGRKVLYTAVTTAVFFSRFTIMNPSIMMIIYW